MNELLRERLFGLLAESPQATNEELHTAYGCFMEQVKAISQSEQNYTNIFRMLNITRIELAFLKSLNRYEQGENPSNIAYSDIFEQAFGFSCNMFILRN